MSDPGAHDLEPHLDRPHRLQAVVQGQPGVGVGQVVVRHQVQPQRPGPYPLPVGVQVPRTGAHPQGKVARPSRSDTSRFLGRALRVVASALGQFPVDVSNPGTDALDPADALVGGLGDSAEMVGLVGTEQGGGAVFGFPRGREATEPNPPEQCGVPTVGLHNSAQLVFVSQPSQHAESFPQKAGVEAHEEGSFPNLVTFGCGVGVRSAPGSLSATYENHETAVLGLSKENRVRGGETVQNTQTDGNGRESRQGSISSHMEVSPGFFSLIPVSPEFFQEQGQPVRNSFWTKHLSTVGWFHGLHLCQSLRLQRNCPQG